jgi:hypothetical protein
MLHAQSLDKTLASGSSHFPIFLTSLQLSPLSERKNAARKKEKKAGPRISNRSRKEILIERNKIDINKMCEF